MCVHQAVCCLPPVLFGSQRFTCHVFEGRCLLRLCLPACMHVSNAHQPPCAMAKGCLQRSCSCQPSSPPIHQMSLTLFHKAAAPPGWEAAIRAHVRAAWGQVKGDVEGSAVCHPSPLSALLYQFDRPVSLHELVETQVGSPGAGGGGGGGPLPPGGGGGGGAPLQTAHRPMSARHETQHSNDTCTSRHPAQP